MDIVFGITTRCENSEHKEDILSLVSSLQKFHPQAKIVVVDSDSPDKSYFEELRGVHIADIKNKNYESGTIWYVFENFVADTYIFLQDSIKVLNSLEKYFNDEVRFVPFNRRNEKTVKNWRDIIPTEKAWARRKLRLTQYDFLETGFEIVFSCSFLAKRKYLESFYNKGLSAVLAENKGGSRAMERILGLAFRQEGIEDFSRFLFSEEDIVKVWRNRV